MIVLEWDPPSDNNSPLIRYNVYISSKTLKINEIGGAQELHPNDNKHELKKLGVIPVDKDETYYEFHDLEVATCYYFVVTAENQHGEGYKA